MIGRRREFAEIGHLLERAASGSGGLLVILGAAGSGRTTLADAAAGLGRRRGFDVARASVIGAGSGLLVWAQVVGDLGAPDHFADRLLTGAGPLELDEVARWLAS